MNLALPSIKSNFKLKERNAECFAGIQEEEIDLNLVIGKEATSRIDGRLKCGSFVYFCGTVRDTGILDHLSKTVDHLEYEACLPLAQKCMKKILEESNRKWNLLYSLSIHRIGMVLPGEIAVVVMTSSPHRKESYFANQEVISRIKTEVPLWKKEVYSDQSWSWGGSCSHQSLNSAQHR